MTSLRFIKRDGKKVPVKLSDSDIRKATLILKVLEKFEPDVRTRIIKSVCAFFDTDFEQVTPPHRARR